MNLMSFQIIFNELIQNMNKGLEPWFPELKKYELSIEADPNNMHCKLKTNYKN